MSKSVSVVTLTEEIWVEVKEVIHSIKRFEINQSDPSLYRPLFKYELEYYNKKIVNSNQ